MVERKIDTRQLSSVYREARCVILFSLQSICAIDRGSRLYCGNLIAYIRDCVITVSEKVGIVSIVLLPFSQRSGACI